MREMLQGKLRVLNAQLSQQDANKEVMHLQIQQLEDRVRRDAEKLEFLGQTVAEYKIRLAWTRVLAWARRTKKETADAETQDGEGLPEVSSISRLPSTVRPSTRGSETFGRTLSKDEERARVVTKESLKGQVIAYSAFWAGVVMQAEQMDFNLRPHLQMTKKELLELIAKTYSEKILAGCPWMSAHVSSCKCLRLVCKRLRRSVSVHAEFACLSVYQCLGLNSWMCKLPIQTTQHVWHACARRA